ncbi:MAG: hypothetical protein KDD12_13030 [Lewinella sp.]|nr:hypothetical protein [Lewinella sp.]
MSYGTAVAEMIRKVKANRDLQQSAGAFYKNKDYFVKKAMKQSRYKRSLSPVRRKALRNLLNQRFENGRKSRDVRILLIFPLTALIIGLLTWFVVIPTYQNWKGRLNEYTEKSTEIQRRDPELEMKKNAYRILVLSGKNYMAAGRWKDAVSEFELAVKAFPEGQEARERLCQVKENLGN